MRQKVKQHKDAGGVTAIALVAVVLYSLWGASLLHTNQSVTGVAEQEKTLAVK